MSRYSERLKRELCSIKKTSFAALKRRVSHRWIVQAALKRPDTIRNIEAFENSQTIFEQEQKKVVKIPAQLFRHSLRNQEGYTLQGMTAQSFLGESACLSEG